MIFNPNLFIGEPLISGTTGSVLFVDSNGNLGQNNTQLFWDTANNRLGISVGSPQATLDILSSVISINGINLAANSITTGNAFNISATGLTTGAAINLTATSTNTTSNNVGAAQFAYTVSPGSSTNFQFYALNSTMTVTTANANSGSGNIALNNTVLYTGTGTIRSITGMNFFVSSQSTGTISNCFGIIGNGDVQNGATITNLYQVYSANPSSTGTGKITTVYGFFTDQMNNSGNGTSTTGGFTAYGAKFQVGNQGGNTSGTNTNYGVRIASNGGVAGSGGTVTNYALYVDSTANSYFAGNVGIGTTSPAQFLDVRGGNVVMTNGWEFLWGTSAWAAVGGASGNTGNLFFKTNYSERMRLDGVGNFGIGTTNPVSRLTLGDATVSAANQIIIGKYEAASQSFLPIIQQKSVIAAGVGNDLALAAQSSDGGIVFYTGLPTVQNVLGTNNSAVRMAIDKLGNVGIGVTNPATSSLSLGTGFDLLPKSGIATTATAGFIYIPAGAGAPTGVPTNAAASLVALYFDTTDNRLYFYQGAAWHYVTQTA